MPSLKDIAVYGEPLFNSYLAIFESSDRAYAEAMQGAKDFGREQTVNVPFPRMWGFEPPPTGYHAPGLRGLDPMARDVGSDPRFVLVRTGWVQEALRQAGSTIARDCIWGRRTAAALEAFKNTRRLPAETFVAQSGHPDWVAVTRPLATELGLFVTTFVPSMCTRAPAPPPPVPVLVEEPTPATSGASTALLLGAAAVAGYYAFNIYTRRAR